jgi:hypothetical protein
MSASKITMSASKITMSASMITPFGGDGDDDRVDDEDADQDHDRLDDDDVVEGATMAVAFGPDWGAAEPEGRAS